MFDGTIESLTEMANELSVQRETTIATMLSHYEQSLESGERPEVWSLQQAYQCFQERLQQQYIDRELAHLAVALSYHRTCWGETAPILAQYRQKKLAPYEEAWAWWHHVDALALMQQYPAALEEQRALLFWAQTALPPMHRLFTIADTTQAFGWLSQNNTSEWVTHSHTLLAQTPVEPASRMDRFLTLRSMFTIALRTQHCSSAECLLTQIDELPLEAPDWERNTELGLEIVALHVAFANRLQHRQVLAVLGEQAQKQYARLARQWEQPTLLQRRCLRRLAHNLGAEFYEAQLYDLARPLFEQAIALGATTSYTYLWLAACVQTLQKDTPYVSYLLHQARARDNAAGFQAKLHAVTELKGFCLP